MAGIKLTQIGMQGCAQCEPFVQDRQQGFLQINMPSDINYSCYFGKVKFLMQIRLVSRPPGSMRGREQCRARHDIFYRCCCCCRFRLAEPGPGIQVDGAVFQIFFIPKRKNCTFRLRILLNVVHDLTIVKFAFYVNA